MKRRSNISRSRETKMPATESLTDFEQKNNAEDNISEMKIATENSSKKLSNCEASNFDLANDATNEFDFKKRFGQNTIQSSSFNQLDQLPKSSSSLDYSCQLKAVIDKVNKLQIGPFMDIYSLIPEERGVSAAAMSQSMFHLAYSHPHSHELHLFAYKSLPSYIADRNVRLTWMNFKSSKDKKTDEEKAKMISRPQVHVIEHNDVSGLCFSSCDNFLLSCSLHGSVKVIGTTTYCVLQECQGAGSATAIDVNPKTINFVTANVLPSDPFHTVHLYDFERNEPVHQFNGHEGSIKCVQYHPNGLYFATAASDKSIKLWSVKQGIEVRRFKVKIDHPKKITFSPDGKYLASTHYRCIKIWDLKSQKLSKSLQISNLEPHILNVCYDATGNRLAAGGTDKKIHIWDILSDKKSGTAPDYSLLKSECIDKRIFSMRFTGTVLSCLTE